MLLQYLADMKAIPTKTAFTARFCPLYSIAKGSISCKVRKAITPPTSSKAIQMHPQTCQIRKS